MAAPPLVELKDVYMHFPVRGGIFRKKLVVRAVDGVSLAVQENEVLALAGESGCGKTTLGKIMIGLLKPTKGQVLYRGKEVQRLKGRESSEFRRNMQIVHQDPYSCLNPARTVFQSLSAPLYRWRLVKNRSECLKRVIELLEDARLVPAEEFIFRYPHQLSGGEKQRISVMRALSVNPRLIMADEAVAAIDVSLRVELMDLMLDLSKKFGTAYLYITHDLTVTRYFAVRAGGRIAIMYLGDIVELGPAEEVIEDPLHPYTKALLSAVPVPDPVLARKETKIPLKSLDVPSPINPPPGCKFHTRCLFVMEECSKVIPELREAKEGRYVACHLY